MPLPNFIIAGVAKAGTSTVYDMLAQHPDVGMSVMKEPSFFSDYWPNWASTLEEYEHLFRHCEGKKAIGEASPFYFTDPDSPAKIKAVLGENVKIILTLRNPARRAYSQWMDERYKNLRETRSFQDALADEESYALSAQVRQLKYYYPGIFRYTWVSQYSEKVARFLEIFGRDHIHVIIFEKFIKDPLEYYRALCGFLDLDPSFSPQITRSNPAGRTILPGLTKLISTVNQSQGFNRFYRLLPPQLKRFVYGLGNKVFRVIQKPIQTELSKDEKLDEQTYTELIEKFLPDIRKLEALLGEDLSIWYQNPPDG